MASNCTEFSFLIDRKSVFSANDIPSIIAYNKCLTNEVNSLSAGLDKVQKHSDNLETQLLVMSKEIAEFKTAQEKKINLIQSNQKTSLDSLENIYDSSLTWYSVILLFLGTLIALAGVWAFVTLRNYKKREINELRDETLDKVKEKLDTEDYTQTLVLATMEKPAVTSHIDSKLDTLAEDIENRVIETLHDRGFLRRARESEPVEQDDLDLNSVLEASQGG